MDLIIAYSVFAATTICARLEFSCDAKGGQSNFWYFSRRMRCLLGFAYFALIAQFERKNNLAHLVPRKPVCLQGFGNMR
jgi:hypothetical protein